MRSAATALVLLATCANAETGNTRTVEGPVFGKWSTGKSFDTFTDAVVSVAIIQGSWIEDGSTFWTMQTTCDNRGLSTGLLRSDMEVSDEPTKGLFRFDDESVTEFDVPRGTIIFLPMEPPLIEGLATGLVLRVRTERGGRQYTFVVPLKGYAAAFGWLLEECGKAFANKRIPAASVGREVEQRRNPSKPSANPREAESNPIQR